MASYKVEICGVNTAKLPILKEEEKDALFARIKQGDTAARETYIKGNLRLVLSVIKRFSGNHENVDDLFQIGCIGLIKSIDNFSKTENKEPTLDEIAAESGISKEDIVFALDAIQSPLSLYDPVYTDGGDTLYVMDQISDKKNREENWIEELSLNDALDEIHISQAQVSRLEKSALKSIRHYLSL